MIEAARKEGVVVWYASVVVNQLSRPMIAAFEKKYPGIKVQLVDGQATDLVVKLINEGRANNIQADVSHGAANIRAPLEAAGLVDTYLPDSAKDYAGDLKDPNGTWVAQSMLYLLPAYNSDMVAEKDAPKSFADLLDPKWKGKMAWTNAMVQGGAPGFIGTVLGSMGEEKGMDYLRKLAAQKVINVPANQRVVLDQAVSGEFPIALSVFINHIAISAQKGAPIKPILVDPVTGIIDTTFLIKGAKHPNAGKLLIDFIVSKEGQEIFREADYIPAHPQVSAKIATLKPEGGNFKVRILPATGVEENMKKWTGIWNELYK
ncbi:ABC transporter substrate-binding protein [Microvirga alba]|uniref:Extracellular solute-binding protein n=1 Tax=Microvirga alba TaxID=2791025 RepID=A0A931BMJ9_9HYPH|nr:extracellular solute-binding protein [Microvirga alba]MBF9233862.1 extracellular solute-binding protein [Microvirga alba]